jgi:predicted MFS family arabinose efflux permease
MAMALASMSAPPDKAPVAIGMVQSAQLLSVAIGPVAGGYVASHFGIRYAFFVTAALCALSLVALIVLLTEERPRDPDGVRIRPPSVPLSAVFGSQFSTLWMKVLSLFRPATPLGASSL